MGASRETALEVAQVLTDLLYDLLGYVTEARTGVTTMAVYNDALQAAVRNYIKSNSEYAVEGLDVCGGPIDGFKYLSSDGNGRHTFEFRAPLVSRMSKGLTETGDIGYIAYADEAPMRLLVDTNDMTAFVGMADDDAYAINDRMQFVMGGEIVQNIAEMRGKILETLQKKSVGDSAKIRGISISVLEKVARELEINKQLLVMEAQISALEAADEILRSLQSLAVQPRTATLTADTLYGDECQLVTGITDEDLIQLVRDGRMEAGLAADPATAADGDSTDGGYVVGVTSAGNASGVATVISSGVEYGQAGE